MYRPVCVSIEVEHTQIQLCLHARHGAANYHVKHEDDRETCHDVKNPEVLPLRPKASQQSIIEAENRKSDATGCKAPEDTSEI